MIAPPGDADQPRPLTHDRSSPGNRLLYRPVSRV